MPRQVQFGRTAPLVVLFTALLAGVASAAAPAVVVLVGDDQGAVAHDMFWPDTVVVTAGQTVQWKSAASDTPHTVTALPAGGPPAFDSSPNLTRDSLGVFFGPGGVLTREADPAGFDVAAEYNHTFETPGTYTVRCKIHPEMIQVITVTNDTSAKGPVLSIVGGGGAHASVDVFSPADLTISKGQTVHWSVMSVEIHTVTGYAGLHKESTAAPNPPILPIPTDFDSSPALTLQSFGTAGAVLFGPGGVLQPQQTFNQTFETAGTFPYFCKLHSGMKGAVIVLPERAGPTGPTGPTGPAGAAGTKASPGAGIAIAALALVGGALLLKKRR